MKSMLLKLKNFCTAHKTAVLAAVLGLAVLITSTILLLPHNDRTSAPQTGVLRNPATTPLPEETDTKPEIKKYTASDIEF